MSNPNDISIMCIKCGAPAAFPKAVGPAYVCLTCQPNDIPTPTPRVDEQMKRQAEDAFYSSFTLSGVDAVDIDFARTLERENVTDTEINDLQLRADNAEKMVCELREALKPLSGTPQFLEEYWMPVCEGAQKALSLIPSSISSRWIERSVVEKLEESLNRIHRCSIGSVLMTGMIEIRAVVVEALALARTELGKGEK